MFVSPRQSGVSGYHIVTAISSRYDSQDSHDSRGDTDISHFREYGSLSELHFYNARLTDEQEAHLLDQMNTKWKDVA